MTNKTKIKIKILELNISEKRGVKKEPVKNITIDNLGVVDDAHRGSWHRQVTLLSKEAISEFEIKHNRKTYSWEFAVNILLEGLDISKVGLFDKIKINDTTVLEVTQIGKKPHNYDSPVMRDTGDNIMFKQGLFARVISGGDVKIGDNVEYIPRPLKIKVITLSDRASRGEYEDLSGPEIRKALDEYFADTRWKLEVSSTIIPDDEKKLEYELTSAKSDNFDFVFTTGGTGISPRDITPDVVTRMSDKIIPGVMDHIRIKYGSKKPNALLSRSVATVMGNSIVYTLPGSVKAVNEYMETILETAEHLLLMLHSVGH